MLHRHGGRRRPGCRLSEEERQKRKRRRRGKRGGRRNRPDEAEGETLVADGETASDELSEG